MNLIMKFLVFVLIMLYVLSPIDVLPAVPVDDIVVLVAGVPYLLVPQE